MADGTVTACLLIIGNEILSGRTKDKNLSYLAERLNGWGIRLLEARVIPDVEETIVDTVNEVRRKFDYVFTTGGIGPTHDDITSECISKAFGLEHAIHPEAHEILKAHYKPGDLNEARLRMAKTPEGAELIKNAVSFAPGFRIGNVHVLAGVPRVMQAMLDSLEGRLQGGERRLSHSLKVFLPEGVLAEPLGMLQNQFQDLEFGSYPFHEEGRFGARLVLSGTDPSRLEEASRLLDDSLERLEGERFWEEKQSD